MPQTVADFVVHRLIEWGVRRVYGYPGDGINGFLGAMERAKDDIRFIQGSHEEVCAFMACAHAKFTGEVGVCMATSGPGAIHLLNGLYDAKMDHAPVLAIVGQSPTTAIGADYQQEVDLVSLYKDVAHPYVHMCSTPAAARHLIDRSYRIAKADRAVTCVVFPGDIQEMKAAESPPRRHGSVFTGIGYDYPRVVPEDDDLRRAADVLNRGSKVAMLIGAGALDAQDEVVEAADRLGAGVAKALLGKAALPDELPFVTGSIGLLGTRPSYTMMMDCDTLLVVGSSFPYSEFLPKEGQARAVQIDIKARNLSSRFPMEVNLHGDSRLTLRALTPLLEYKRERGWRQRIEREVDEWWRIMEARAHNAADPINPQRLFWELSPRLPDNCILAADSGSTASWFARDLKIRRGMLASLSGNLATMCPGVPYVLAAKFAYPDRVAIGFVGDGAMQMLGMSGMITIAKFWKEWQDPRLLICVLNNHDLNQVSWEQRVMAGDPKFPASQDLLPLNYARYAQDLGLMGIRVERPEDIGAAWDQALAADRPCLIDCLTDPDVPPLPPHVTFEQARMLLHSMIKGDPDRAGMIRQSYRDLVDAWLPPKREHAHK